MHKLTNVRRMDLYLIVWLLEWFFNDNVKNNNEILKPILCLSVNMVMKISFHRSEMYPEL